MTRCHSYNWINLTPCKRVSVISWGLLLLDTRVFQNWSTSRQTSNRMPVCFQGSGQVQYINPAPGQQIVIINPAQGQIQTLQPGQSVIYAQQPQPVAFTQQSQPGAFTQQPQPTTFIQQPQHGAYNQGKSCFGNAKKKKNQIKNNWGWGVLQEIITKIGDHSQTLTFETVKFSSSHHKSQKKKFKFHSLRILASCKAQKWPPFYVLFYIFANTPLVKNLRRTFLTKGP